MQKHNRRGRASLRELNLHRLLVCAVEDASGYLRDTDTGALLRTLASAPKEFRSVLDDHLHNAESGLASGGGVRYMALRQLQALLKKVPDWHSVPKDKRVQSAMTKFSQAELKCKLTNKRLSFARQNWSRTKRYRKYATVVNTAMMHVQEILGVYDHDTEVNILEECRFGSGATFGHSSEKRSIYYKLSGTHTVTKEAIPLLRSWFALSPRIKDLVLKQDHTVVDGNRLSFVPKDWDIDRTIAVEPSWNVLLQLGFNGYFSKVLKRFGIFLNDQSKGYSAAREGSITGAFATIDLSSASDTVSIELVKWLLPGSWFEVLDSIRSKNYTTTKEGKWTRYHKFSSMGNGFTFPLESVIFMALARATARCYGLDSKGIVVYGDDIVIPRDLYCPLVEVLRFCGFEPNSKKSFVLGHFRETCGRDFLQGVNVRPVYLRKSPRSVEDVYSLYNRLLIGSLLPMPRTLAYLRNSVKNPHLGPAHQGINLPFDGLSWKKDSRRYESFFYSDPPVRKCYAYDLQTYLYSVPILDRKRVKDQLADDEYVRYLCFLYGIEGGIIYHSSKEKWFERVFKTTFWPDLQEARRAGLEGRDL